MRVVIISYLSQDNWRGPLARFVKLIPYLTSEVNLTIIALNEPDNFFLDLIGTYNIDLNIVNCKSNGWQLQNKEEVSIHIIKTIKQVNPDIVILNWEYWDLILCLSKTLCKLDIPFAVIFHSVPFIGTPLMRTGYFYIDIMKRIKEEHDWKIKLYILQNCWKAKKFMLKTNKIVLNSTVENLITIYYDKTNLFKIEPGFGPFYISNVKPFKQREHDFVFMASLYNSKGIFHLIEIMKRIIIKLPNTCLHIIGEFSNKNDKIYFHKLVIKNNLIRYVHYLGWLSSIDKYEYLENSKVFIYPSWADTYSIAINEALACGLPVICYDLDFSRDNYFNCEAVIKIKAYNYDVFAERAIELLNNGNWNYFSQSAVLFSTNLPSWREVADSEITIYRNIINHSKIQPQC